MPFPRWAIAEADAPAYEITLPAGYETSGRYYPTVYLLHQFNSDHTSYRTDHVDALLDEGIKAGLFDKMIVVIPNSSENSWWTGEWEKMITEELIPLIDGKYRTINDPRYRLTVGCSMGGQGAYAVALRNPDYFTGAVSFFGAFSFGAENSPNAIASKEPVEYLKSYALYFICGNQDSYGFGAPAIQLHQQLNELGVAHRSFIENGGHDSAFYVPFFQEGLAYARANMNNRKPWSNKNLLLLFIRGSKFLHFSGYHSPGGIDFSKRIDTHSHIGRKGHDDDKGCGG